MITHVATAAVYVSNQEEALKFWTKKMGFEMRTNKPMGPQGSWIEVAPPGAESAIVLYPKAMMPNWKELKPSIVFQVDDMEGIIRSLHIKGVRILEEPKKMNWGTYARFADPDGNEFLLRQQS